MQEGFRMSLAESQTDDTVDDFPQPQRTSLATAIADSVAEAIATRRLQPGERVVETAMAERFKVSRVPIREALKVLHAQGILSGGGHRGFRVSNFGPETIDQVFEVRLMLETFLLRDAVDRWRKGEANVAELDGAIRQMDAAARADDRRASLRADVEFHRTICRAAGNPISSTLWEAIARHVLIIFSLEAYRDSNLYAIADQHRAFRDFIVDATGRKLGLDDYRKALEDHILLVARAKRSLRK
jgi:DNA-binding GntR family transcriptional regulator